MDLANTLGLASISAKIPGGPILIGALRKVAEPVKKGVAVSRALKADPDVLQIQNLFDAQFPGIASAIGIAAITETED